MLLPCSCCVVWKVLHARRIALGMVGGELRKDAMLISANSRIVIAMPLVVDITTELLLTLTLNLSW